MFGGSLRVGTVCGVPVRLHLTLPIVFVLLVARFGIQGIPVGLLLYGSVLLHELGHAMMARSFGIPTAAIDLHLLGGMALMTQPAQSPSQEARVAVAGPAVSGLLGTLLAVLAWVSGARLEFGAPRWVDLWAFGAAINLGMAIFNLVPALPMDGGRIFRAFLSERRGHLAATRIAAAVSRAFAIAFVAIGLVLGVWSLALVGFMLFFLVGYEQMAAQAAARRSTDWMRLDPRFSAHGLPMEVQSGGLESREEYVDRLGRRYVVVTRIEP